MSTGDRTRAEQLFEQRLLESARFDVAPANVEQAWANFSRALSGATAAVEPSSGLRRIPRGHTPLAARVSTASAGLTKAIALLAVGAIVGSTVTLAIQGALKNRATPVRAEVMARVTTANFSSPRSRIEAALPSITNTEKLDEPHEIRHQPSKLNSDVNSTGAIVEVGARAQPGSQELPAGVPAASTGALSLLALEVRQLDSIRTACRAHAYSEVLRLVAIYHHEFPKGVLSPDADVLTLEALAERHDYPKLAASAAAFLSRYPNDPHAAKVREWAKIARQSH